MADLAASVDGSEALMIRPLRRRHLMMQGTLAVVVLVGMVQGIRSRQPIPTMAAQPANMFSDLDAQQVPGLPVRVHLMSAHTLLLHLQEPLQKPDVLVYLAPTAPTDAHLPAGVFLLGSVGASSHATFAIPEAAQGSAKHLILYSLGHQQAIGHVELEEHH